MNHNTIYIAGGCFWGLQKYFDNIKGIVSTKVGYINGSDENTNYDKVCNGSGHAEVIEIFYDKNIINLKTIFNLFIRVIDPTSLNKQNGDIGVQYRSGIYSNNKADLILIKDLIKNIQKDYDNDIVIEVKEIINYIEAEESHQKYLKKNPSGYCSIKLNQLEKKYRKGDNL